MSKNISHLSDRKGLSENLFETLGRHAANEQGIQEQDIKAIAEEYLMGNSSIFGAASFYDFTRASNAGKQVYVCNGSACLVARSQQMVHDKLSENFAKDSIGEMCCLGRCHENKAFHYQGKNYSGNDIYDIEQIKSNPQTNPSKEKYHTGHLGHQILTGVPIDINTCRSWIQTLLSRPKQELLEEIKISGLRGRGGAGFPIAIKLDTCMNVDSDRKFIVCNADEGDPGSYSDRYLLEHQPELVLLGMMIAAYIISADRGVVYIRAEYPESVDVVQKTVEALREHNCLGENILGSGFDFEFKVIKAQGAYICGEETALLSSIEGQRAEVRVRPPFPVYEGLFRKPTVVNNVETLANLPWIIMNGGAAYKAIGTAKSTGTKLISLDSGFQRPGIYEADMGATMHDVIDRLGHGFSKSIKALHIGGPLGGLVPMSKISDLSLDFESFASNGFMLGHASIISVPEDYPLIKYLEHLFEFTAHESCGKCFPCRIGSTRGRELIHKAIIDPTFKIETKLINDLLDTMRRGSLCALGGGIPLPVMNAMTYFKEELQNYFKD